VNFWSARISLVVLVDEAKPRKTHLWDEIVIVFRAKDYKHAFTRALQIGRSHETEYLNCDQRRVRWALVEIENLDPVGRVMDGAEVASRLKHRRSKEPIPFDTVFHPENSDPGQSF